MKTQNSRILLAVLLLTALFLLAACGDAGTPPVDTTAATTTEPIAVTTEPPLAELVIVEGDTANYRIVRPDLADDATTKAAITLCTLIENTTGVMPDIATDWLQEGVEPDANTFEILIGATNHPESSKALAGIPYGDWILTRVGNKLVINAWSEEGIQQATGKFTELVTTLGSEGSLVLPADILETGTVNQAINFIPYYENATLSATYDAGDENTLLIFHQATLENYTAYRGTLEAAGFSLYTENDITENRFATYINDQYIINVGYYDYEKAVRLIYEPRTSLPTRESDNTYEKLVEPSCLLRGLGYNDPGTTGGGYTNGMCIVFQTADGSYIIIDGGFNKNADAKGLYEYMYNHAPDKNNITIAAWIITHAHGDHFGTWSNFSKTYAKKVTLEQFICNFPAEEAHKDLYDKGTSALSHITKYKDVQVIKAHVGQEFFLRDARVEILFTLESYAPTKLTHENTSSIILSVELGGQKFMILGDASNVGCGIATQMYGNYLKSDFVQVTHHGVGVYGGDEPVSGVAVKSIYTFCAAPVVLWPASNRGYREAIARNYSYNTYLINAPHTKEIFVAGSREVRLILPYTPGTSGLESILK